MAAAYGDISLVKIQLQISAIKLLISSIHILEMNKSYTIFFLSFTLRYTSQNRRKVQFHHRL